MKKVLLVILLLSMCGPMQGWSQGCAVCTKTAAGLDDKSAQGMNNGILYLAFFPLTILGTIGFVWWRANRNPRPIE